MKWGGSTWKPEDLENQDGKKKYCMGQKKRTVLLNKQLNILQLSENKACE